MLSIRAMYAKKLRFSSVNWFVFFQLKEFYLLFKNKDGVLLEHYVFSFDYSCNDDKENIEGSGKDSEILYKICKRIFDDIKRLGKYKKWDENNTFDAELVYNDNGKKKIFFDTLLSNRSFLQCLCIIDHHILKITYQRILNHQVFMQSKICK